MPLFIEYNHTCTKAELLADKTRNQNIRRIQAIAFYSFFFVFDMLIIIIGPILYWDEVNILVDYGFRQVEAFLGLERTSDFNVTLFIFFFLLPGHSYYFLCGTCRFLALLQITMLLAQIGYSTVITKIK